MSLLRLTQDAKPPWLSQYSPSLARVTLVPAQGSGPPILLCPDFLLAASPLIRSLVPEDHLPCPCQPLHILLPDVPREDLLTALQVITHGSSTAITGVVATNEKLWSVSKVLKTLAVDINLAFDLHSSGGVPLEIEIEDSSNTMLPSPAPVVTNVVNQAREKIGTADWDLPVPRTDIPESLSPLEQFSELGAGCEVQWQEAEVLESAHQLATVPSLAKEVEVANYDQGEGSKENRVLQVFTENKQLKPTQVLLTEDHNNHIEDILNDGDDNKEAESPKMTCPFCRENFKLSEELLRHQKQCREKKIMEEGDYKEEMDVNNGSSRTVTCCVYCKKTVPVQELLLHHIECSEGNRPEVTEEAASMTRPHKCLVCGQGSKTKPNLLEHMESHRYSSHRHRCLKCNKSFKLSKVARKHMRNKHNLDMFFCTFHDCSMSFSDKESFITHTNEVHSICKEVKSQKPKCKVCGKNFKYHQNMTRHMHNAHNMKVFACFFPGCGVILENKLLALQHRKDLHVKNKLKVIKVPREIMEEGVTSKKMYSLAAEKHKCDVCNESFSTEGNARRHKEGFHSTVTIECDLCSTTFKWKYSLQYHMKNSHKSNRIICRSWGCSEILENNEIYRQHKMEIHPRPKKKM